MKDRKTKEKKHESTIGKIIYGFLLFMPLFAIGVTCGYAMFNKNAYQSYYGNNINDYTLIRNTEELDLNKNYVLNSQMNDWEATYRGYLYVNEFNILSQGTLSSQQLNTLSTMSVNRIYLNSFSSNTVIGITLQNYDNNSVVEQLNLSNVNYEFEFKVTSQTNNALNYCYYIEYNQTTFVSEVFYYSIDKVQQSPLFNWAENSVIYTGMNNFTNSLSITTPFIPLLLTYWLIISIVYFLYDIVLIILVVLHKKIHALEESI